MRDSPSKRRPTTKNTLPIKCIRAQRKTRLRGQEREIFLITAQYAHVYCVQISPSLGYESRAEKPVV
jgi:hypothetical protein